MRTLHFLACFLTLTFGAVFLAVPLMLLYALRYRGYELLAIGVLVDAYYGAFREVPLYTLLTAAIVLLIAIVAPYFMEYTEPV